MGKNTKRRKGTWTPHPVDGCEEQDNLLSTDRKKSLKRKKKTANHNPALKQLLGDSFPRTKRFDQLHNVVDDEERFADLSDIVATDWRMPPELSDEDDEELYQSRKLVMRQLVMNQLSFIRQHFNPPEDQQEDPAEDERQLDRDGVSSVDSWQEMEERFAEIYEPIPYDVAMDSWRSMTREQMLKTVTSRRLRSRMKYMSRAEILSQIQTLKSHHQKDAKSPVYEDMSGTIHPPSVNKQQTANTTAGEKKASSKKKKKVQMAANKPEPVYQNTSAYSAGMSLADIYQAKVEARRQELQLLKEQKASKAAGQNGLYVTKALVHAPPPDEEQQRFLSRASILSKLGTPSTAGQTKSDLIAQFWRQSDYITTEYSRKIPAHSCSSSSPESSCPSDCEGCCDGGEACSMCSCSSCGSRNTVRSVKKIIPSKPEPAVEIPEPIPLSLVKQRKMEFERLRILEEQENRLQELVRHTRSESGSPASQSWGDLAQRARQLEDKWNRARRSSSTVASSSIYEPVPASQLLLKKEEKNSRTKKRSNSKKRSKVIQQLKSRMRENLAAESLDPRVRQRRHQELQELLSDAVHAGTQTLTNINLGLIYVPMEQQEKEQQQQQSSKPQGGLMTLKTDRSQLGGSSVKSTELAGSRPSDESEDLFGSIDTLIFEPKVGGSFKTDELDEVEERIAQQFDYLNDSQYGSCDSSDDAKSTGSKNGRRAAAAAVAAASPPPNPSAGTGTESCAAVASCDASASENAAAGSSTMDSNVDTDASWDYYPDGDGLDRNPPNLAVGNLRKKPPDKLDEADETARLLESLRMAEDSNVSTSLRLIFPPGTLKLTPAKNNIFTDVVQSPDSGFRSLPDMNQIQPANHPPHPGLRKRDTMIRELKMKLRDKFHCVDDVVESRPASPFCLPPLPGRQPECGKKKPKVMSKLESILASFNALAQMKAEGRVYRTAQPISLPAECYDYDSSAGSSGKEFQSTGYPHHLLQRPASTSEPTTIYDPSLPDHYAEIPHPMEPMLMAGFDPRLRGWYDNALFDNPHENLYNISDPLEERCSRNHRRAAESTDTEDEVDPELTWSDIENQLFNEEVGEHFMGAGFAGRAQLSRMAPYQDDWLFWDQLQHCQWNEADRQHWEEERARRMLLWIHHSQGAGLAGSRPPHWWQVLDQ